MPVTRGFSQTNSAFFSLFQNMMTELCHSFATVKAEAPTRVAYMTGPAETVNGEVMQETLEVLGHGLGLMMLMEI